MKSFGYLEKAVTAIKQFGSASVNAEDPVIPLIKELQVVDESKAIVIARTLQHSSMFNDIVRQQVADMKIGARYENITQDFDSIIEDTKTMLKQMENNETGMGVKFGRWMMKMRRGTIHDRFDRIKEVYIDVTKDTKDQLDRESAILEAYLDYRNAVKEAEINAAQMYKIQTEVLAKAKQDLIEKNAAVEAQTDPELKNRAQLARDESQRAFDREDRRYQLLKTISEQLTISYNVGDTVIANLNQTRAIKQTVYEKAVIFFKTNESVLTSLDAALTSTAGLNEGHKSVDAMVEGTNKALETLAEVSSTVKMNAIKTAYGSTIKADSVKKVIESMIKFQQDSQTAIQQLRLESAKNAVDIEQIVDQGKNQLAKLVTQASV